MKGPGVYRVVLVDDEPIILRSLKVALPWDELNMLIVGEATNGEEGWRLIQELKPDIVISDIRMPVKDGISMMKETLSHFPSLIFVLLSGYGEFDYAREAVRSGAFDYLLKPVDHEELESVMREAARKLDQEAEQQSERDYLTKSVQSLSSLVRERMVSMMLEVDQKPYDPVHWVKGWELEFPYVMLVISLDDTLEVRGWSREDRRLWFFAVGNVLAEYGQSCGAFTVFPFRSGEWIMLLQRTDSQETSNIAGEMIELVKTCTKLDCSVGISRVYSGLEQLYACYLSAQQALRSRFTSGKARVYTDCGELKAESNRAEGVPVEGAGFGGAGSGTGTGRESLLSWELKIHEAVAGFDKGLAAALLGQLFRELRSTGCSQEDAAATIIEFAVGLSRQLSEGGRRPSIRLKELMSDILVCVTIDEMEQLVRNELWSYLDSRSQSVSSQAEIHSIRKAMEYMTGRFHHDLGMDEVAEFVGLSCSHFCVLFKKESGYTFLEYLTKLRIDRACSILRNTEVKVYQIAPLVGYQDPKYFTQVFKKMMGMTPSEYRTASAASGTDI